MVIHGELIVFFIARSNNTKVLTEHVLIRFRENYVFGIDICNLGV